MSNGRNQQTESGWSKKRQLPLRYDDRDDNNSLDRRLIEAREEAIRLERMFAENRQGARRPHFANAPQQFMHEPLIDEEDTDKENKRPHVNFNN